MSWDVLFQCILINIIYGASTLAPLRFQPRTSFHIYVLALPGNVGSCDVELLRASLGTRSRG